MIHGEDEEERKKNGGCDDDDDDDDDDGGGADAGGGDESRDWSLVHCHDFSTDLKTSSHHCLEACWQVHVVSRRFFVPRMSFLVSNKTRLSFTSIF